MKLKFPPLVLALFVVLIAAVSSLSQYNFDLANPSRSVRVHISVAECDADCHGPATFTFTRKGSRTPFQTIVLPDTQIWLGSDGKPSANVTLLYDQQSAVNFGDFNFDGLEDVALCDGGDGAYGGPTYRIYLASVSKQYLYSSAFSRLTHDDALGMFEVDKRRKMLIKSSKSGCCWHRTEGFVVASNRPRKVYELTEDATGADGKWVRITTRRLVGGKWQTKSRREKIADYYKD